MAAHTQGLQSVAKVDSACFVRLWTAVNLARAAVNLTSGRDARQPGIGANRVGHAHAQHGAALGRQHSHQRLQQRRQAAADVSACACQQAWSHPRVAANLTPRLAEMRSAHAFRNRLQTGDEMEFHLHIHAQIYGEKLTPGASVLGAEPNFPHLHDTTRV